MKQTLVALCLSAFVSFGQGPIVRSLQDLEAQWVKEYKAKDVDKVVAHYADTATVMAPGMPVAFGKDAIRSMMKEMLADPNFTLSFQSTRIEASKGGDFAFTQGSYSMTMSDPKTKKPVKDQGSYVTVYRKLTDGSWKAVSDIATSEPPNMTVAK